MANWGNHRMYAGPILAILEAQTNMGDPNWWNPQSSERTMHRNGLLPEAWTGRANQQGGSEESNSLPQHPSLLGWCPALSTNPCQTSGDLLCAPQRSVPRPQRLTKKGGGGLKRTHGNTQHSWVTETSWGTTVLIIGCSHKK